MTIRLLLFTFFLLLAVASGTAGGGDFYVAPAGDDAAAGTLAKPFASLDKARDAVRAARQTDQTAMTVYLRQGTYYLSAPLVLETADSGTASAPITYTAYTNEKPTLSGGVRLQLEWTLAKDGIHKAVVPKDLRIDQLFVDGRRQHMARYPNYDPAAQYFNGFAADSISAARAKRWADPSGGFIHAMHRAHWGDMHYLITGKDADGNLTYVGGWQNNRPTAMHNSHRFVENIYEELNAPGEWYLDARQGVLYFYPPQDVDLSKAKIEGARLVHLIELHGTRDSPVRHVTFRGLRMTHTARTFMDNKEPLLRSDWTTYRGGAIFVSGGEDILLQDLHLDSVGSNAIFVNKYNRRVTITGCTIAEAGASGVCFVGDVKAVRSPLLNYDKRTSYDQVDKTPGPKTLDYPAECRVHDNLIYRSGRFEKQTAGVQISMSSKITVSHNSIYDVPRAGINISEGTWGGHLLEFNDVFDTVKETGDHGSFNSWGRDRFWELHGADVSGKHREIVQWDAIDTTVIRNNRFRCDHGWDIDLDDGSTNYHLYNNLCLHGGLKLREGFFRKVENNIIVGNSFHPHVWYRNSGDVFRRNIVGAWYKPIRVNAWGDQIDYNLMPSDADLQRSYALGLDEHSLAGDPLFVDPAGGDYRVQNDSPALKLGFKNFAMDQFGVIKPELKAVARRPEFPDQSRASPIARGTQPARDGRIHNWNGAKIKNIVGFGEQSASGLPGEIGVLLVDVSSDSAAAKFGLRKGDVILGVDGHKAYLVSQLQQHYRQTFGRSDVKLEIFRDQKETSLTIIGSRDLVLHAGEAKIAGEGQAKYDPRKRFLGSWRNGETFLVWQTKIPRPDTYRVTIVMSTPFKNANTFEVHVGKQVLLAKTVNTGGWDSFRATELGTINVRSTGQVTVALKPTAVPNGAVMNVRDLVLTPVTLDR
ncbi:MAG: PDZ domain-containing protein [Pirellulales bacterium]